MLFSGKNIIVTGATGDLGVAIVQRLIRRAPTSLPLAGHQRRDIAVRLLSLAPVGSKQVSQTSPTPNRCLATPHAPRTVGPNRRLRQQCRNSNPRAPIVDFPEKDFVGDGGQHPGVVPRHEIRYYRGCAEGGSVVICRALWAMVAARESAVCGSKTRHHRLD